MKKYLTIIVDNDMNAFRKIEDILNEQAKEGWEYIDKMQNEVAILLIFQKDA